jgi:hypothetical protein
LKNSYIRPIFNFYGIEMKSLNIRKKRVIKAFLRVIIA